MAVSTSQYLAESLRWSNYRQAIIGELLSLKIDLQELGMNAGLIQIKKNTAGFLCESINTDNLDTLKRLIKLHLANEEQLTREIDEMPSDKPIHTSAAVA